MRLLSTLMLIPALASGADSGLDRIEWMVGCWTTPDGSALEVWVVDDGQSLSGFGVALNNGQVGFYEVLRIRQQEDGRWTYSAHPSGQDTTSFFAQEIGENSVVFTNPDHDFPQEIKYRREGNDLYATTSLLNGIDEISFFKIACESTAN